MSDERVFIDTNVFVYIHSGNNKDKDKRLLAYEVIEHYPCIISTQVLNEFCNICIKKLKHPANMIQGFIDNICKYCDLIYVDEQTISKALYISSKYGLSYYDCLMIASAIESNCTFLYTEDMADKQVIEKTLTIKNFFNSC